MNAPVRNIAAEGSRTRLRCRAIEESDLPRIEDLLTEGFSRKRRYWARGLARLAQRDVPEGTPRFGFLLEADGGVQGCLLLIVSEQAGDDGRVVRRANVSSWYVRPQYRSAASMLVSVAFRQPGLTFVNISPAPHTVPILKAQGYTQYVEGQFVTAAALSRQGLAARVTRYEPNIARAIDVAEDDLLRRHAALGCIVLLSDAGNGARPEPFVFVRRRILRTLIPAVQLVWCRDMRAYADHAGATGRYLLRLGRFAVCCDANAQMESVPGLYRAGRGQKFYRGPDRPRLGDLADTELAIFGA